MILNKTIPHKDTPEPDRLGLALLGFLIFLVWTGSAIFLTILVIGGWPPKFLAALRWTAGLPAEILLHFFGVEGVIRAFDPYFENRVLGILPYPDLLPAARPVLIAGGIGAGIGVLHAFQYYSSGHFRQTDPIRHLDGPKLLQGLAGAAPLQKQIAQNFDVDGIFIHPNVRISMRLEIQHVMLIGATGGGKTTTMWQILDQIIAREDKVLTYDVKSDFTQKLKKRLILGPGDRRSLRWLAGMDITTEALAQAFAECFIVPNPKVSDPVWDNAARALLRCEIHKLMSHMGTKWTFSDLGKGLLEDLLVGVDDPVENMRNLQAFVRLYYPEAWQIVRDATSKATSSVLFTQGGQLSSLIDICRLDSELAKAGAKGFWLDPDTNGFLSDEVKTCPPVVLKRAGDSETWSKVFFSALINVAALKINTLGDVDPDKRRIWILLDEVPQLGKIPQITTFLETSRSKGIRLILGLQNPEQIEKYYGKEDRAAWENLTLTKVWFQDVGKDAKKWASESVGTHTVQVFSKTVNTGTLPPSSGDSKNWSAPQEKRLLEEHAFEMLLRPKPKKKIVTALLQIAGFDRVILDWPMIPRPIHDPKANDRIVLPPRVIVGEDGQVIASNLTFVESSLSPPPGGACASVLPPSGSGGGPESRKEDPETEKREPRPAPARPLETVEIPQQPEKPAPSKEKEGEDEIEKEASEIGEKMLTAGPDIDFTGDTATDSLKLLAALLDSSGASGTVGKVQIAKPAPAPEPEREDERE